MTASKMALLTVFCLLVGAMSICGCGESPVSTSAVHSSPTTAAALAPIPLTAHDEYKGIKRISFSSTATLPTATEAMVYKIKPVVHGKDYLTALASKLGLHSGTIGQSGGRLTYATNDGIVFVDRAANSVQYDAAWFEKPGGHVPADVRTDSYYRQTAETFLKEKGLWQEKAVLERVENSTSFVDVRFHSKDLNGMKWAGVGPLIDVVFGGAGKIGAFYVDWPELEPYSDYPVISATQALADVKAGKHTWVEGDVAPDNGVVTKVELVYYYGQARDGQQYVAPYYRMTCQANNVGMFTLLTQALPENLVR